MSATMQAFYDQLRVAPRAGDSYLARLARLTQATRRRLQALNLYWVSW